jgi:hypothetical protein
MTSRIITTILVLLVLTLPSAFAGNNKGGINKENLEIQTEYGPVILQNVSVVQSASSVLVSGIATNQTNRAWRYFTLSLRFRDKSGRELKSDSSFDDSFLSEVHIRDFGKGETKPLAGPFEESPARVDVRLVGKLADFELLWVRERSYYDSRPTFDLIHPSQSNALLHDDEAITIKFVVAATELQFALANKTQEPLSINWDEVSFIDLNSTAHRVLHQGVRLVDRDKPQAPTVVPPYTKINDSIAPVDGIEFNTTISDWDHQPLLPPSQEIVNYKGKTFGVFMPLVINGQKKSYTFTIRIDDVEI